MAVATIQLVKGGTLVLIPRNQKSAQPLACENSPTTTPLLIRGLPTSPWKVTVFCQYHSFSLVMSPACLGVLCCFKYNNCVNKLKPLKSHLALPPNAYVQPACADHVGGDSDSDCLVPIRAHLLVSCPDLGLLQLFGPTSCHLQQIM